MTTSPDPAAIRDVYRARAVLEGAGVRRWPVAPEELRERVHTSLAAYTAAATAATAARSGVPLPRLEECHRAFHVSLVALTVSPHLVRLAEELAAELGPALARLDHHRTHHGIDSHVHLVRLLELGDHEAAAHHLARHLAEAEVDVLRALGRS